MKMMDGTPVIAYHCAVFWTRSEKTMEKQGRSGWWTASFDRRDLA